MLSSQFNIFYHRGKDHLLLVWPVVSNCSSTTGFMMFSGLNIESNRLVCNIELILSSLLYECTMHEYVKPYIAGLTVFAGLKRILFVNGF
jgi:hypothetical protein